MTSLMDGLMMDKIGISGGARPESARPWANFAALAQCHLPGLRHPRVSRVFGRIEPLGPQPLGDSACQWTTELTSRLRLRRGSYGAWIALLRCILVCSASFVRKFRVPRVGKPVPCRFFCKLYGVVDCFTI